GPRFTSIGARATVRSSSAAQRWDYEATLGTDHVSDSAPMTLWPGAGEGRARAQLLRAHPLLDDGIIDLAHGAAFGRSIQSLNAEARRWFARPQFARLGVAAFVDSVRASRSSVATHRLIQTDVGAGLRVRMPGVNGVLRIDAAHGLR